MGFPVRNTGLGKDSGSEARERAFQYGALMVGAGLGERGEAAGPLRARCAQTSEGWLVELA